MDFLFLRPKESASLGFASPTNVALFSGVCAGISYLYSNYFLFTSRLET